MDNTTPITVPASKLGVYQTTGMLLAGAVTGDDDSDSLFIETVSWRFEPHVVDGKLYVTVSEKSPEQRAAAIKYIEDGFQVDLMQEILTEYSNFVQPLLTEEQVGQVDQIIHDVVRRHYKDSGPRLEAKGITARVADAVAAIVSSDS